MTGQNQRGQDSWLSSSLQRTDAQGGLDAAPQQPRASRDEPKGHQNKPHWGEPNPTGSEGHSCGLTGFGPFTWLPFYICLFLPASSATHPAGSGPSIRHVDHYNSSTAGLPACSFVCFSFFPTAFSGSLKKHPSQFISTRLKSFECVSP